LTKAPGGDGVGWSAARETPLKRVAVNWLAGTSSSSVPRDASMR
jgi:hypothetical protein